MASKIPAHHARVMPYLHYHDPNAALDFLGKAFGFSVRFAHRDEAGRVLHAPTQPSRKAARNWSSQATGSSMAPKGP